MQKSYKILIALNLAVSFFLGACGAETDSTDVSTRVSTHLAVTSSTKVVEVEKRLEGQPCSGQFECYGDDLMCILQTDTLGVCKKRTTCNSSSDCTDPKYPSCVTVRDTKKGKLNVCDVCSDTQLCAGEEQACKRKLDDLSVGTCVNKCSATEPCDPTLKCKPYGEGGYYIGFPPSDVCLPPGANLGETCNTATPCQEGYQCGTTPMTVVPQNATDGSCQTSCTKPAIYSDECPEDYACVKGYKVAQPKNIEAYGCIPRRQLIDASKTSGDECDAESQVCNFNYSCLRNTIGDTTKGICVRDECTSDGQCTDNGYTKCKFVRRNRLILGASLYPKYEPTGSEGVCVKP